MAEVEVTFAVFTHEPFQFQEIAGEVGRMRRLGMSLRAIGRALGVDEKTVRKVLGGEAAALGSGLWVSEENLNAVVVALGGVENANAFSKRLW